MIAMPSETVKPKIFKDVSKWTLLLPKVILDSVNLWPERQNLWTKTAVGIMVSLCVLLEISQVIYFVQHLDDIAALTQNMSTLSVTFQAITKMLVIFCNTSKLNAIIKIVWYEFWPSRLMGKPFEKTLRLIPNLIFINLCCMYITGELFSFGFLSVPLIDGNFELPYASRYPFDWQASPYYEMIYILQCFINMYVVMNSICGHDYLFVTICTNCIAQFKLLNQAFCKLGTGLEKELNTELFNVPGVKRRCNEPEEKTLLVICVEHHQKLIKICEQLDTIFSTTLFVQLAASVMALCVSGFLITQVDVHRNQQTHLLSYSLGHLSQLFIFCAISNELTYQSKSLSNSVFGSGWYLTKSADVKKCIPLIIQRSQKGNNITALNMFDMNYATFILVLRFSFSMYTLLTRLAE